jgi:hypothetical protein
MKTACCWEASLLFGRELERGRVVAEEKLAEEKPKQTVAEEKPKQTILNSLTYRLCRQTRDKTDLMLRMQQHRINVHTVRSAAFPATFFILAKIHSS